MLVGAILKGEKASVRKVNAAVSEGLAQVVERCIALDPGARFSSAAEIFAALRGLRERGIATFSALPDAAKAPSLAVMGEFPKSRRYWFLELVPLEGWCRQFDVNVIGLGAVTQAFLPHLR